MKLSGVICIVLLMCFVKQSLSCNGFEVKVNNIKNCTDHNLLKLENFKVELDKNCDIVPRGCVIIKKSFKTAKIRYSVEKSPFISLTDDVDMCKLVRENKNIAQILRDLTLPHACPVKAQKICNNGEKKYNLGKFKNQLGLLIGNTKVKLDTKHNNGNTCMEFDIDVRKIK